MSDKQFPDDYYDERGVYIPRLYGRPWYEWAEELGLHSIKEIDAYLEARMDIIGQNGNVGYTDDVPSGCACPTSVDTTSEQGEH